MNLKSVFITSRHLILVSFFSNCQSLKTFLNLKVLSFEKLRVIFFKIVQAVKSVHDQNIAHRDIKLDNIIINDELEIELIDFGYSRMFLNASDRKSIRFCGTPLYMAPELISKRKHDRKNPIYIILSLKYFTNSIFMDLICL